MRNQGIALFTTIVFIYLLMILGLSLAALIARGINSAYHDYLNLKVMNIAEAGVDKAIWSLNNLENYQGETKTALGDGGFDIAMVPEPNGDRAIEVTAYLPFNPPYQAQIKIKARAQQTPSEEGVSFHYAVQNGNGGLVLQANSKINGSVYSNGSIQGASNSQINGDAYAVGTISSPYPAVSGNRYPNSPPTTLPSLNYDFWKAQANANNDPYEGDLTINSATSLGPKKIQGNLTLNGGANLKVTGPIYVTGNFVMNSNSQMYLDPSFQSKGTVLIVDGTINISSNTAILPTNANPKGYLLLVTTNSSDSAINISSNTSSGIFYALGGTINLNSNAKVVAVVGKKLVLASNAQLDYDLGLASAVFTSGPGGVWQFKAGSWEIIY